MIQPLSLRAQLRILAGFLPLLDAPGFSFGAWVHPQSTNGRLVLPFYAIGETASALHDACYAAGWVLEDFDWPTWKKSEEATRLRDDPEFLSKATPDQLARILTVLLRQERFCEGSLNAAYESGLLLAILRRAAVLESELPPSND